MSKEKCLDNKMHKDLKQEIIDKVNTINNYENLMMINWFVIGIEKKIKE